MIIKKLRNALLLACLTTITVAAQPDTTHPLLQFGPAAYEGWTYHRSDIDLNRDNVAAGRIVLFTTEGGQVCTLESPVVQCDDIDSLSIWVEYHPLSGSIASKLELKVELLDADTHNSIAQVVIPVAAYQSLLELQAMMAVPADGQYVLLFSAPKADLNSNAYVRSIKVWAVDATIGTYEKGDVNGDGSVDVSDVNTLINIVLGKASSDDYDGRDRVNDDDEVDVSDVNALINILLGK